MNFFFRSFVCSFVCLFVSGGLAERRLHETLGEELTTLKRITLTQVCDEKCKMDVEVRNVHAKTLWNSL